VSSPILTNLEKLLAQGKDTALLRYSLGNEYLKLKQPTAAAMHLEQAVKFDSDYSAAWKLLGKAFAASGREEQALDAWRRGIEVAEAKGDKQAAAEMKVFLRRIEKKRETP
jgi:predicted Zn-dependent protease